MPSTSLLMYDFFSKFFLNIGVQNSPLLKFNTLNHVVCLQHYAEKIRPMVCDTVSYMNKALQNESANIIVEGANALMLDIDFGKF